METHVPEASGGWRWPWPFSIHHLYLLSPEGKGALVIYTGNSTQDLGPLGPSPAPIPFPSCRGSGGFPGTDVSSEGWRS